MIAVLASYINGEIKDEQYWNYFDVNSQQNYQVSSESGEKLYSPNKFKLVVGAKYRTMEDIHVLRPTKGSFDEFLIELYLNKEKLNQFVNSKVKIQLEELLSSFNIKRNKQGYVLMPNKGYNVERIKEITERLLDVIPEDLRKISQNGIDSYDKMECNDDKKPKKIIDNLSSLTAFYIGIHDKEKELEEKLESSDVVFITGLGGMGKSTLSMKLGEDYKNRGWQVRWLNGGKLDDEFFQLAKDLEIETNNLGSNALKSLVYQGLGKIHQTNPILLIFDNAEDGAKIRQYLENRSNGIKVIITTRNSNLVEGYQSIQMNGFNEEQALRYVQVVLQKNKNEAKKLVETVGLSPFRLSKAVAYWSTNDLITVNEYIKQYKLVKEGHEQNADIYPEVEMLFGNLRRESSKTWRLLEYMVYLGSDAIPVEFIMQVMGQTIGELQKHVNELKKLSLINVISDEERILIKISHKIVEEETKKTLADEDGSQVNGILEKLMMELGKVFENIFEEYDRTQISKERLEWLTFARTLLEEAKTRALYTQDRVMLLYRLGLYCSKILHNFQETIKYWEDLLSDEYLIKDTHFPQSLKANVLNQLGGVYVNLQGEENANKGLGYYKKSLGLYQTLGNHKEQAHLLIDIGITCLLKKDNNGKLSAEYFQSGLNMVKQFCLDWKEKTLKELLRIGIAYIYQESNEEIILGIVYLEKALKMHYEFAIANNHQTAELLNSIAFAYTKLNDDGKALEYYKQAYCVLFTEFGDDSKEVKIQKDYIEKFQPEFFERKSKQTKACLGADKVGSECRYLITSRGVTDENLLKIKQKIHYDLWFITLEANVDYWTSWGWSSNTPENEPGLWASLKRGHEDADYGIKGHMERFADKLAQTERELAEMLCFEAMNLGIMQSEKKDYEIVKSFTQDNPELVKKIAEQHPEFFVDGTIVESCLQTMSEDSTFMNHIFENVQYIGMKELRKQCSKIAAGF